MRIKFFGFVLCLFLAKGLLAQNIPPQPSPPRLVTDFTLTLSQDQVSNLEHKLAAYADSTSSQIAIVVVKDIGDYDMASYATQLATSWGIGGKENNNGLLILWATGNRKIYIATGYGMEEKVPDAIAKRIVNEIIIPNFREGRYYQGLNMATDEIIARLSGTYKAETNSGEEGFPIGFFLMLLMFMLVFIYIARKNRGNRFNNRNGGGFGGFGGGIYPPWTIGHGGGYSGGWDSQDSNWGGGGGFGGFGGGDFGGGGAGGDY
jgi:uncharacterized protein